MPANCPFDFSSDELYLFQNIIIQSMSQDLFLFMWECLPRVQLVWQVLNMTHKLNDARLPLGDNILVVNPVNIRMRQVIVLHCLLKPNPALI